jgi:hypothetical protein
LVVILSAIAVLKAHALFWLARRLLGDVGERTFWLILLSVIGVGVASFVIFFLRQAYRECVIEEHLFCASCNMVDSDDEGYCTCCGERLSEKAGFYYTSYESSERKLIARFGLLPCAEASRPPVDEKE